MLPLLQHPVHLPHEFLKRGHVIHEVSLDHLVHTLTSLRRGHPVVLYVLEVCCDPLFLQVIEVSNDVVVLEPVV